jgi:hypothetical protein
MMPAANPAATTTVTYLATYTPVNFDAALAGHSVEPPSCEKGSRGFDKRVCEVEKCMLRFHTPIAIVTHFQAVVIDPEDQDPCCPPEVAWHTVRTELHRPHWGISTSHSYWPAYSVYTTDSHGRPSATISYHTPAATDPLYVPHHHFNLDFAETIAHKLRNVVYGPHGEMSCLDQESCCRQCHYEAENGRPLTTGHYIGLLGAVILAWSLAVALLYCCGKALVRWTRRAKNDTRGQEKYDPSAAGQDPQAGRGTMGRRAEEGRNPMPFSQGHGAPEVIITTAAAAAGAGAAAQHAADPQTAERVVTSPASATEHAADPGAAEKATQAAGGPAAAQNATQAAGNPATATQNATKTAGNPATATQNVTQGAGNPATAAQNATQAASHPAVHTTQRVVSSPAQAAEHAANPTTTTTQAAAQPATHAVENPATTTTTHPSGHDGAADSTGFDTGSVRGRKRTRMSALNLNFH